jgi:DNA-binding NarL/FixJ family response regulator
MIKVSIIEDHQDFREGLSFLLNASEGYTCISNYTNAEDAVDTLSGDEDVILLDINLPEMSGIEAIPLIKAKHPYLKIIMLTICDDDQTIIEAIMAGADGYLLKKTAPDRLLTSLQETLDGGSPMTASIASRVLNLFKKHVPVKNNSISLTARELEVLQLLVDGLDNISVAKQLFISIQTVRNHIRHIYEKLQVHSKSQAVAKAIKEGLV